MKTRRGAALPRARKQTKKGGTIPEVKTIIDATAITPTFVNPESKFVVATYWWGRNNVNGNLQRPCPEEITDDVRDEVFLEVIGQGGEYAEAAAAQAIYGPIRAKVVAEQPLTPEEESEYDRTRKIVYRKKNDIFQEQRWKDRFAQRKQEKIAELTAAGQFTPGRTFGEMIAHWEGTMRNARCNYVATNTEFPERRFYQYAINGKPMFIKKVLDTLRDMGKKDVGVLYIDGDMDIHTYPSLFDTPNVDFMARGWNIDPRDHGKYFLDKAYFNPYIFETSGGTMFFGNTDSARRILDSWIAISASPEQNGKADDRLLSMVYTTKPLLLDTNLIQLPIEYLWLTDKYQKRFQPPHQDASKAGAIIEHPACLTGEERAAEQGASTNRQPIGYEVVEDTLGDNSRVYGGILYEHIFFPNDAAVRPWLDYMKKVPSHFKVVPRAERYGEFNAIADANTQKADSMGVGSSEAVVELETNATIPTILAYLQRGKSVFVGTPSKTMKDLLGPEMEFGGYYNGNIAPNDFKPDFTVETGLPVFLSHKNPVLIELVRMCETLKDINKHLKNSYMFMSRIRWKVIPVPEKTYERIERAFLEPAYTRRVLRR